MTIGREDLILAIWSRFAAMALADFSELCSYLCTLSAVDGPPGDIPLAVVLPLFDPVNCAAIGIDSWRLFRLQLSNVPSLLDQPDGGHSRQGPASNNVVDALNYGHVAALLTAIMLFSRLICLGLQDSFNRRLFNSVG